MPFTTQIFTFGFMPLCFFLYYLFYILERKSVLASICKKLRLTDIIIIGFSVCFYAWAGMFDALKFILYILLVFIAGIVVQILHNKKNIIVNKNNSVSAIFFFIAIAVVTLLLVYYKYTGFIVDCINTFMGNSISSKTILAPLGISFITFSAISYLADIYMGKAKTGSIIDCALYLSFFPKVVSGPIVLWRDFRNQIGENKVSTNLLSEGVTRVMVGFAKKIVLADTFGVCIASASNAVDIPTAWGVALLYMLQIYFDFSGYSDIAIGFSNMLGFSFNENFNFPYLSCSITEFWRRWHISLGAWFREYIYFPLGGNRKGKWHTVLNIGVVFLLTGIWHGAGWTYILWGMINGVCNIFEKLVADKSFYKKTPKFIKWSFTMIITFFCWELFRFPNFSSCISWFKTMLGLGDYSNVPYTWNYYFSAKIITFIVIGILGSTMFGLPKIQSAYKSFTSKPFGYIINQLAVTGLFVLAIVFMINSTYSPFIYFQY